MINFSVRENEKKAAFVALVGRPSTGKSTLVNRLCGGHVAIVSPVPQTTRNAIRGIVNHELGQLVLVDTPGIHLSERKFNRHLGTIASRAVSEADITLYVMDASRTPGIEEEAVAERLKLSSGFSKVTAEGSGGPAEIPEKLLVAVNKMDLSSADFPRALEFVKARFPGLEENHIIPISAQKNEGIEKLLLSLFSLAPRGDAFYPENYYTDQEIDFRIAEIIRGAAIHFLHQELPHAIYVEVADRELRPKTPETSAEPGSPGGEQVLWVRSFILCERESQKGMIVGKGGNVIKEIGKAARKELNRIFDWKVELDLRVKTGKDWRHNDRILKKLVDR